MEKVPFIQDPFRALKQESKPWDTKGKVIEGDFIHVLKGEFVGKEGFVKHCHNSYELLVEETSKDIREPLVTLEDAYPDVRVPQVSVLLKHISSPAHMNQTTFTVPVNTTFCYDRLQIYDLVKIIHGPKTNTIGHIIQIHQNGYLKIKEIAPVSNIAKVGSCIHKRFHYLPFIFDRMIRPSSSMSIEVP